MLLVVHMLMAQQWRTNRASPIVREHSFVSLRPSALLFDFCSLQNNSHAADCIPVRKNHVQEINIAG